MENSQASSLMTSASTGVAISGPFDHGFAWVVSFRDPDGNHIELLQSSNTEREG